MTVRASAVAGRIHIQLCVTFIQTPDCCTLQWEAKHEAFIKLCNQSGEVLYMLASDSDASSVSACGVCASMEFLSCFTSPFAKFLAFSLAGGYSAIVCNAMPIAFPTKVPVAAPGPRTP